MNEATTSGGRHRRLEKLAEAKTSKGPPVRQDDPFPVPCVLALDPPGTYGGNDPGLRLRRLVNCLHLLLRGMAYQSLPLALCAPYPSLQPPAHDRAGRRQNLDTAISTLPDTTDLDQRRHESIPDRQDGRAAQRSRGRCGNATQRNVTLPERRGTQVCTMRRGLEFGPDRRSTEYGARSTSTAVQSVKNDAQLPSLVSAPLGDLPYSQPRGFCHLKPKGGGGVRRGGGPSSSQQAIHRNKRSPAASFAFRTGRPSIVTGLSGSATRTASPSTC